MADRSVISRATSTLSGLANKAQNVVRQVPNAALAALGESPTQQEQAQVFGYPVAGGKITQQVGVTNSRHGYASGRNEGLDIAAASGTNISAPIGGTIIGINPGAGAWGNQLLVDAGDNRTLAFNHMSGFADVKKGQTIKAGDILGQVGSSGNTTGPHLDLEATVNGTSVPLSTAFQGYQFDKAYNGMETSVSKQGYNRSQNTFYDLNDLSKSTGSVYRSGSGGNPSGSSSSVSMDAGSRRDTSTLSETMLSNLGSFSPTSGVTSTKRAGALGVDVNG